MTDQDRDDAATYGWELSVTMRLVKTPSLGGNAVYFFTGARRFAIQFSTDPEGALLVSDSFPGGTYRFENDDDGYHRYSLVYDPSTDFAALRIDGVDQGIDFRPGNSTASSRLWFGAGQTDTHAHWNEVSLTIIPEPAAVALVSGIFALAGAVVYRRKRTRQIGTD